MTPSELLERLAVTFRSEVGPAIEAEYPRTQAFISAVVLQKLARQLDLETEHDELERREREAPAAGPQSPVGRGLAPRAPSGRHSPGSGPQGRRRALPFHRNPLCRAGGARHGPVSTPCSAESARPCGARWTGAWSTPP